MSSPTRSACSTVPPGTATSAAALALVAVSPVSSAGGAGRADVAVVYASPREYHCSWKKVHELERQRTLRERVEQDLANISLNEILVASFFLAESVAYTAD